MNLNEKKKYKYRIIRTLKRTTTMSVYEQGTRRKEQAMITNNATPPLFKIFRKKNRMSKKKYEKRILNLKKSNPGEGNKKNDWTRS